MQVLKNKYIKLKKYCPKSFLMKKMYGTGRSPPADVMEDEIDSGLK